jgi:hypothetical protein
MHQQRYHARRWHWAILGTICAYSVTPVLQGGAPAFKVLVFSKTAGFRHTSIPDGIAAVE